MSDEKVKQGLESCNLCNAALVDAIRERVKKGDNILEVCKDYERYQEQVGIPKEAVIKASVLRGRYYRQYPANRVTNVTEPSNNSKLKKKREKSKAAKDAAICAIKEVGSLMSQGKVDGQCGGVDPKQERKLNDAVIAARSDTNALVSMNEHLNGEMLDHIQAINHILNAWEKCGYNFFVNLESLKTALSNLTGRVNSYEKAGE